ncbi:phosphotransferase [Coleofasciculus sp.]|uniref:phosphotransferase n=1 Tax=Coleofasciculus sp. TaxID=3100458 RepID=UPI003A40E98B
MKSTFTPPTHPLKTRGFGNSIQARSAALPQTSLLQTRPFGSPARVQQQQPDTRSIAEQLEGASRFGYHGLDIPVKASGTSPPPPPSSPVFNRLQMLKAESVQRSLTSEVDSLRSEGGQINPQALQNLLSQLPQIGNSRDKLVAFAASRVGRNPNQVNLRNIKELKEEGATGVSGAPVFFLFDDQGQSIATVKLFPNLNEFARELSALKRFEQEGFEVIESPQNLGVAKAGELGVLVSLVAPGVAIDDYLQRLGTATGENRSTEMERTTQAVKGNARALSELHSVRGSQVSEGFLQQHINAVRDIEGKLSARIREVPGIEASWLHEQIDQVVNDAIANPGQASLIHGDAHPGNFFWDQPSEQLTAIDTPTMHYSMGEEGEPIGAPARDYGNFYQKLAHFGVNYEVLPEEVEQLQQAFADEYHGEIPAASIKFFRVRAALGELMKALASGDRNAIDNNAQLVIRAFAA